MLKLKSFLVSIFILLVVISGCLLNNRKVPEALTIWHWMTDREDVFKELAKRYEAKTGIKINFELYAPSEAYSQKVRAARSKLAGHLCYLRREEGFCLLC